MWGFVKFVKFVISGAVASGSGQFEAAFLNPQLPDLRVERGRRQLQSGGRTVRAGHSTPRLSQRALDGVSLVGVIVGRRRP